MSSNNKKVFKMAFVATLPVMAGYLVLGIGFGVMLASHGFGGMWAFCMSTFIYAGSMQFVAIDFLSNAASITAVALTTLLVNARHLFYGVSMIDKYNVKKSYRPYLIFALTDETYSLVCSGYDGNEEDEAKYYLFVSVLNQLYWVTGSVLGGIIGEVLSFDSTGIDYALTALFLTVMVNQWEERNDHIPAIIGICASVVALLIFGRDGFLLPAMAFIALSLLIYKKFFVKDSVIGESDIASNKERRCDE